MYRPVPCLEDICPDGDSSVPFITDTAAYMVVKLIDF